MKKRLKKCTCGSDKFVSMPNRYDIYQIINEKLELIESPFTQEEIRLYCRECGKELLNAVDFISEHSSL
jgi:rRNA maturation protein Nop10